MRFVPVLILMAWLAPSADFECHVRCPAGYTGGCVKSATACDCSCRQNSKDVYEDILGSLKRYEVSQELLEQVNAYLQGPHEQKTSKMTFTDKKTNKHYTILLKEFS